MTRFRIVSLCLVALFCLGIAAPVVASPPLIVPAGLVETVTSVIEHVLVWLGEIVPSR